MAARAGEYGDVHRVVVQTFMSKRVIPEKEALELVKSSARKYPECQVAEPRNTNELGAFFQSIDKEIGEAGVGYAKLKQIGFTKPGSRDHDIFWGLQSVKDDIKDKGPELAKLMESKKYSDEQLCLFKLILEELCTVNGRGKDGMLDHNTAINLHSKTKPKALKVDEAMSCIDRLQVEGWLKMEDDPNGRNGRHTAKRLTLGVRSMIDLQNFISDTWRDELRCEWKQNWLFQWIAGAEAEGGGPAAADTEDEDAEGGGPAGASRAARSAGEEDAEEGKGEEEEGEEGEASSNAKRKASAGDRAGRKSRRS